MREPRTIRLYCRSRDCSNAPHACSFDSFSEGDLYYGLAATTSGGNKSTNLTANFGALRIGTQVRPEGLGIRML